MNESPRIKKLFTDLYEGNPWIDITLTNTLNGITAAQAAKKVSPHWNTIWEIINHMISWRQNVLGRVNGEITDSPADNYFAPVTDTSEAAWSETLQRLKTTQEEWTHFLSHMKEEIFDQVYPNNNNNYYEHIHGILQHDAYHLGQVVLLAKVPF